jgi:hypothetical protein
MQPTPKFFPGLFVPISTCLFLSIRYVVSQDYPLFLSIRYVLVLGATLSATPLSLLSRVSLLGAGFANPFGDG